MRYVREKPSWLVMFICARTLAGRRLERLLHRAAYRHPRPATSHQLSPIDLDKAVDGLVTQGVFIGLRLEDQTVAAIRNFALAKHCYARDRQDQPFLPEDVESVNRTRERDVIAAYYFEAVEESPEIRSLRNDPVLLSIAEAYLGQEPIWNRTRLWWSFPAKRVSDADLHAVAQDKFHFDMNEWRTLKFFFYLTPIDEKSGPHRCIVGSHRRRPLRQQFTVTVGRPTEELEDVYGEEAFRTIIGEAGTGFAEDPFVFHTGSLCEDKPRLILEFEFGARPANPSYEYGRLG
ncbi:phytanoyl-CoA dioxygenase family protein [Arboricoccus pini]|nr:phytanoyl-CoA dioxygenase family protein [Arboricoccus pini]